MTVKASKRYPGRISVLAAGIIIVFIGMAAAMGYLLIRNPSIEPLVRMIPDDAVGLAITRFSAADALELNAWEIASEIGKNHQKEVGAGFEKIKEYLGVDPSDKNALLSSGVDLFKPMGFSVHMLSEEEAALAFYLPYNDRKGLQAMVDHLQEKMGWNIHESKHEDTTVFSFDDGSFSYTFLNGHLIAVYSMNPVETDDVMVSILDRKSKEAAHWLGELLGMANHDWQMFAAINAREAVTVWSDLLATPEIAEALSEQAVNIDEVGGLALAFDVKPQSITFKAHVTYVENPELPANWYLAEKEDRIADEMPGDALASFRVALDWDKVMGQMEEKTSELNPEDLEQLGQSLGIDNIRRDLLENLGSPTVITVVDGQGPETMELGGVLRIPVKDGQSLNLVLEQLAGSMNEHQEMVTQIQEGETLWYRMDMEGIGVNWAVHKDHLMVSVGEAITGLLQIPPAEGSSFLSTIKDVEIREHLRSKGDSVMYVNLAKTLDMFKEHMTDMPSEGRTLAMSLGGLHMVNETTEKSGTSTMVLTSREGTTFTAEILELIRSQP